MQHSTFVHVISVSWHANDINVKLILYQFWCTRCAVISFRWQGTVVLVVKHVGRGVYIKVRFWKNYEKNHNSPLCQCLYFLVVLVYDLKSHKNHTYWCWCTNYALNTCPRFALISPHLGYIDTTRTPSEYHDWECRRCAQARYPSALLKKSTFIWGHPPSLSATDLWLDPAGFHPNFFSDWPRVLVSYPNQWHVYARSHGDTCMLHIKFYIRQSTTLEI
jgi:hypothetical protein